MIIDVSSAQGFIDYQLVKKYGVSNAILHISAGVGKIDDRLIKNAIGFANEGISISYYHCAHPDKREGTLLQDALAESNYIINAIKDLPKPTRIWTDLENWDANGTDSPLNKEDFQTWLKFYIDNIEMNIKAPNRVGIYSTQYYLDQHLPKNHIFSDRDLWIANYNKTVNPKLPNGWSKAYMRQYTCDGVVSGIKTKVDLTKLI